MTGHAFDQLVCAVQRVVRVDIVVEVNRRPRLGRMAGLTGSSEMTVVVVVLEMAGDACDVQFVVEWILAVTVTACQLRVLAIERKTRVAHMIEFGVRPCGRRVAVAAFLAAAAVMGIVLGVAVEAIRRWRLEGLVFVAAGTLRLCMLADQREAGRVVVEFDVGPGDGGMAVAALRAHGVAVNVVRLMAGETIRRRIAVLAVRLMAFRALGFAVLAEQQEVGEVVVERTFVELHDIGVPALVVGVTARTAAFACLVEQAVISATSVDIVGDVLVTVEAQRTLLRAFELSMAGVTVVFVLRMTFDDLTRHDQESRSGRAPVR